MDKPINIVSEKVEKPTHMEFFISVDYDESGMPMPFFHQYPPNDYQKFNGEDLFRIELPVKEKKDG